MGAVPRGSGFRWLVVKIWSLLGTLNIRCRIIKKDPKRDPNIDNHPDGPRVGCRDRFLMGEVKRGSVQSFRVEFVSEGHG